MKVFFLSALVCSLFMLWTNRESFDRKDKLSEYHFFVGKMSDLKPAANVFQYDLNTPLFSNYAEKIRFIRLPKGASMVYQDSVALEFPIGSILIKNFYYPNDFRNESKGRKIIETRLLVHEEHGWQAYPYIWNEDQSDAFYDPAGETQVISYISQSGKKVKTNYVIPNKNQCKGCHVQNNKFIPLGPSARQLNRNVNGKNQLLNWHEMGLLRNYPVRAEIPQLAVWDDPATGDLNARARAYLDSNCGHCHSGSGPASTSGLYLDIFENDPAHLGVRKAPVAAGRGAGDLQFDIEPGKPQRSIVIYRMKTNDPAIAMPEIGREQVHTEGVELIEAWIRENKF